MFLLSVVLLVPRPCVALMPSLLLLRAGKNSFLVFPVPLAFPLLEVPRHIVYLPNSNNILPSCSLPAKKNIPQTHRALPVSALDDDDDDDDDTNYDTKDDEKNGVQYNYTFFHLVFALAAMYISMVLTNWNTYKQPEGEEHLILIGQSWPAVWVKVVSSWICYGLYGFSLLAPVIFPDRFADY